MQVILIDYVASEDTTTTNGARLSHGSTNSEWLEWVLSRWIYVHYCLHCDDEVELMNEMTIEHV